MQKLGSYTVNKLELTQEILAILEERVSNKELTKSKAISIVNNCEDKDVYYCWDIFAYLKNNSGSPLNPNTIKKICL